ncbi:hypothetical protein GOP47_0004021 [Adiantum capillus-veneris]|uniref:Heterokaryon incompatibility domain-containing protein n=1 Tax=Adiantum capillus-veneris TaxID=13818 RepID=A0A9D4V805_ADICA|nr:hypothetical protein GOP47_0004021 [Adiantum capillus-veneris]
MHESRNEASQQELIHEVSANKQPSGTTNAMSKTSGWVASKHRAVPSALAEKGETLYGTGSSCDAEDDNNMDATPLRLIDVEATLSNDNAGGIIFTRRRSWHVISHTWSADVRKLSKIIGKRLSSVARTWWPCCNDAHAHGSYEQLFATSDFSKESSYKKLLDFLTILRSDQVKWVWFDAVCINQQDREEKEREIGQMGLYYEKSIGCHVVHHGIGRGFKMQLSRGGGGDAEQVGEVNEDVIPRWFSRAWTFQEWILPPKTTFIIDLELEQSLARTAYGILLNEHEQHETCSCCFFETSLSPIYVRKFMVDVAQQPIKETATGSAAPYNEGSARAEENGYQLASLPIYRIRRCCRPSIREPHFKKVPNRRNWYFADDLGFAFLIGVKLQMAKIVADHEHSACKSGPGAPGMIAVQQQKDFALNDAEYEVTRRLELKGYFRGESDYLITKEKRVRLSIEEMQVRDCSNAEDRVLSVLKLLGVEGLLQVRSSKSLKQQVIQLARASLLKEDDAAMVLQLCLVDGFGNETSEMSWAPHFEVKKGSWQAGARLLEISGSPFDVAAHHFDGFKAEAQVRVISGKDEVRAIKALLD